LRLPPPPPPPLLLLFAAAVVMWTVWLMRMTVQLGVILGVWNRMVVLFHGVHVEGRGLLGGCGAVCGRKESTFSVVYSRFGCVTCVQCTGLCLSHARERIFKRHGSGVEHRNRGVRWFNLKPGYFQLEVSFECEL
jgi:hypothetical protein